jgi:uncharacterized protein
MLPVPQCFPGAEVTVTAGSRAARRRRLGAFACVVVVAGAAATLRVGTPPGSEAPAAAERLAVVVDRNVEAVLRDGVVLRADVYRPDSPGRFPVLLQRTPYSKSPGAGGGEQHRRLAARGFVVIIQDTRGRYTSEGEARPHDEAEDGHDTVEWAAALPYADGRVAMWGSSYLATTSLQAASASPPHLVAIQPTAAYSSRYHDLVFQGGAFYLRDGLSWNLGQAADVRRRTLTPDADRDAAIGLTAHQRALFQQSWLWHVPLATMDALDLRQFAPNYFDMLDHPEYGPYWEPSDIAARHDRFEVPALHIVGWYDVFAAGTTRNFAGLRARARTEHARRNQRLVVGFWTHSTPGPGVTRVGDVDFGPGAAIDVPALRQQWLDCWLKDEGCAAFDGPAVRLFITGENRWRDEHEWPLARARYTDFFLRGGGAANTLHGDGRLGTEPPGQEPPDRFLYDPWDPVPTGPMGGYSRLPADQRPMQERPDVLVYTTEPLAQPLEVTGPIEAVLWIASSAPDTDFTARLSDVHPDGTARLLTDGIQRARYRRSRTSPEPLVPGQPTELTIDLGVTGHVFLPGHRIRLDVSSSNFPRFDRNPNTGGPFAREAELRTAYQTVFHDAGRPSRLVLPVIPR